MSNKVFRIARKEFLDMFRDKRTLIRMMLIPLIAFPAIIYIVSTVQSNVSKKNAEKVLKVGYVLNGQDEAFLNRLKKADHYTFIEYTDSSKMRSDVKAEKIDIAFTQDASFDSDYEADNTAKLYMVYRGADNEEFERFATLLDKADSDMVVDRLKARDISVNIPKAFKYRNLPAFTSDVSDYQEKIGKYGGGILPYIFIAFCFMGCMYPAIDLFAGEKERGTLETLLISPVDRRSILVGKMIVITAFGLISATIALIGLFMSLNLLDVDVDLLKIINEMLTPKLFLLLYILLIPLTIFFTGVMTPISIYARSFKEAQSVMVPLNMLMVLPAIVGFLPTVELNFTTAFIPIVNVVLATKQIIGGNIDWLLIGITFITLVLFAVIAVMISHRQFGKESNILRGE